jgi:hypothetical protein
MWTNQKEPQQSAGNHRHEYLNVLELKFMPLAMVWQMVIHLYRSTLKIEIFLNCSVLNSKIRLGFPDISYKFFTFILKVVVRATILLYNNFFVFKPTNNLRTKLWLAKYLGLALPSKH